MHTLDLLMKQGLIIVSIFIVLGLFIAAVVLIVLPQLRKMQERNAAEARRRAAEQAILDRADHMTAADAASLEVDAPVRATPVPQRKSSSVPEAASTPASGGAVVAARPAPKLPTTMPVTEAPKPETSPASEEEKPSSDMQDLLNSVFSDDEAQERYQLLMQGHEPITAVELLDLAEQVSEKLRQRLPNAG